MGCVPEDHILPLTIWSRGNIQHKISCIAFSRDLKHIVTGSWDGNLVIWTCDLSTHALRPCWIVSGQGSAISAIACFKTFFIACLQNGTVCHFQLPSGHLLLRNQESTYLHTTAAVLDDSRVICTGYYPDLVIIDAYTLEISAVLLSRIQSDWVACIKTSSREGIKVQGITVSGVFKTWSLTEVESGIGLESHSSPIGVTQCLAMSFDMKNRFTLLITCNQVKVFDYNVSIIYEHNSQFALEGGDFYGKGFVIWTKRGDLYYCDLSGEKELIRLVELGGFETHVPGNRLIRSSGVYYYIVGDISGFLSIWRLQKEPTVSANLVCCADASDMSKDSIGLLDYLNIRVTCSVHISKLDKFITGCSDGTLLVFPTTELIMSHFFIEKSTDHWALIGHKKTVQCILYPHSEQSSFSENLLVSGSDDYSVCFWDIFKRELLHKFCVHAGPVLQLMVPPFETHSRFAQVICSVSSDHSVALLSYKERRCIFLASQHPFPIVTVRWKPSHDFMIVKCYDGSVFVWELKTGDLDRLLNGVAAEEVVYGCGEVADDILWDFYTKGPSLEDLKRKPLHMAESKDRGPVHLRGILSNPYMESYVLLINLSSLLLHLEAIFPSIIDEPDFSQHLHSLTIPTDAAGLGLQKRFTNVLDAIKQEAGQLQERFHLSLFRTSSKQSVITEKDISAASSHQLETWSQMILSFLHCWNKNTALDQICLDTLGFSKPKSTINFDLFSMYNVVSLRNPSGTEVSRTWFDFVAMRALARTVRGLPSTGKHDIDPTIWENVVSSNIPVDLKDFLSLERLAFIWQASSLTLRCAVQRVLPQYLLSLKKPDSLILLEKWRMFLPTASSSKQSLLASVAISLVGVLTIDGEIRSLHYDNVLETCESIRYAISTPSFNPSIQATAIDILGRGYLIWENALPVDETLILIFDRCAQSTDCLVHNSARETLRTVARNRMSQFVAYLKLISKNSNPAFESSKIEIISVLRGLLIEFPWGLPSLLSDVIEVLLSCIDPSHLKSSELFSLLPGMGRVQQVHHSVTGQRVAVGMPDGKVVVHDLRTHRCHVFIAHYDAIRLVRFSSDGKNLVTLSDSGSGSIWQLSHGLFDIGVGQFRFKLVKKFDMSIESSTWDEGIDIDWTDLRSVNVISTNNDSTLSSINVSI